MAKCVLMYDGEYAERIIRVPDKTAEELVKEGRAHYESRKAWKAQSKTRKGRKFVGIKPNHQARNFAEEE